MKKIEVIYLKSKWISWLKDEKRLSLNTVMAYERDLKNFFKFLMDYFSKEIVIDNTTYQIKSIYDLSGHNMAPYIIHLNKAVPNIRIPYYERMKEDEVFAIETFPTTGSGDIYNCSECNHFMIEQKNVHNINEETKKIYDIRKTLAFCPRWFNVPQDKYISKFPILKTTDGGRVAQYEKTIYVKSNKVDVIN